MVCGLECARSDESPARLLEAFENGIKLENRLRRRLQSVFRRCSGESNEIETYAKKLFEAFAREKNVLVNLVATMLRIANLEREMSSADDQTIRMVSQIFCFPPQAYELLKSEYCDTGAYEQEEPTSEGESLEEEYTADSPPCPDRQAALKTLGCKSNASEAEIREAFRKLALIYHPDIHASIPLPEEFVEDINRRFREIQRAYELLQTD